MRRWTLLAGLLMLCSGLAPAQPPRGFFPWWESPITRDLNLSEDQTRRIRETMREYRSPMIDQRAAVEKAEGELEDLFNEDPFDEKKAQEATSKLVNARAELTRSFTELSVKLRMVLTPSQWRELQRRRRSGPPMRRGGPGGPRGPGGGPGTTREAPTPPNSPGTGL